MRAIIFPWIFIAALAGCASTPEEICDHGDESFVALAQPPPEAASLLAAPGALDTRRDHIVWLRNAEGDLALCVYRKAPRETDGCGGSVMRFERTAAGYEPTTITTCGD